MRNIIRSLVIGQAVHIVDSNWIGITKNKFVYLSMTGYIKSALHKFVNTSGKAGAQIPHLPWEMIHLPGGDNAVGR
jgi:hypothetical protein